MNKFLIFFLLTTLLFSCKKEDENPIELGFNTGYETPSTDKPFYKSTDSIKFEMTIVTNIGVSKNQIDISLGDENGIFDLSVIKNHEKKYVNLIKGYFKPLNKTGDFDLNIKLSNSKSEKLITKTVLLLPELNVDDVLPEINKQQIISAFPLKYQFCNFTSETVIASSNPTEIEMGHFNLDASTNTCGAKRVFINGFNGDIVLNLNFNGKFESITVKHGNTVNYPSLNLEKILAQLAPFYGARAETGVNLPNTRFAKINTVKGIITVYDNGLSVNSTIKLK